MPGTSAPALPTDAPFRPGTSDAAHPHRHQVGFVSILIKPFFEEWSNFLGEKALSDCVGNVTANVARWEAEGEGALGDALDGVKYDTGKSAGGAPADATERKSGISGLSERLSSKKLR